MLIGCDGFGRLLVGSGPMKGGRSHKKQCTAYALRAEYRHCRRVATCLGPSIIVLYKGGTTTVEDVYWRHDDAAGGLRPEQLACLDYAHLQLKTDEAIELG